MQALKPLPRSASALKSRRPVRRIVSLEYMREAARASGALIHIGSPLLTRLANDQLVASVTLTRYQRIGKGKTDKPYSASVLLDEAFIRTPNWMHHPSRTLCEVAEAEALRQAFTRELWDCRLADEVPEAPGRHPIRAAMLVAAA